MHRNEIAIWTTDGQLLEEISNIDVDGVELHQAIFDSAMSQENITAYIGLATGVISFLAVVLPLIANRMGKASSETVVYVRTEESSAELESVVLKYTSTVKIEIQTKR
jgi:hypothetical protein